MRTRNKYAIGVGLGLTLCAMMIYGCCCRVPKPTPDPLAGWQMDFDSQFSAQNIEKDYRDYIHGLSPAEQQYTHIDSIYKDGTGQHAVKIEIDIDGKDCWYHVLFYDKDNKRVKVVKYFFGRFVS